MTSHSLRELTPLWSPARKIWMALATGLGVLLLVSQFLAWTNIAIAESFRLTFGILFLLSILVALIAWLRARSGPRARLAIDSRTLRPGKAVRLVYEFDSSGSGELVRAEIALEQRRYKNPAKGKYFDRKQAVNAEFDVLGRSVLMGADEPESAALGGELDFVIPEAFQRTYRSGRVWVGTMIVLRVEFERGPALQNEYELILHRSEA